MVINTFINNYSYKIYIHMFIYVCGGVCMYVCVCKYLLFVGRTQGQKNSLY